MKLRNDAVLAFAIVCLVIAIVFLALAAGCGDNMKPPLPPCPDGNHLCNRSGVCSLPDGSQCQLSLVDGGVP